MKNASPLAVPLLGVVVVLGLAVWMVSEPAGEREQELSALGEAPVHARGAGRSPDRLVDPTAGAPRALRPVASLGLHQLDRAVDHGAASLFELNAELVGDSSKKAAKQEAKLAKLQASAQVAESQRDGLQAQLEALGAELPALEQVEAEAAAALAELEAAGADKAAVQAARKELKAASKALASAQGKRKGLQKKLAKATKKLAKLQGKVDDLNGDLIELEDLLETLLGSFAFDASVDVSVDIQVLADASLGGARVDLVAALDEHGQAISTERYGQGLVVDGRCVLDLRLPGAVQTVDVIVTAPGYTGSWTHEAVRLAQGAFAPAVRRSVSVEDLAQLSVSLVPGGTP